MLTPALPWLMDTAGYQKYNVVAKKLDRRLAALGAIAVLERGLGDDQHPSGYEAALDAWLASLWEALRRLHPLAAGLTEVTHAQRLCWQRMHCLQWTQRLSWSQVTRRDDGQACRCTLVMTERLSAVQPAPDDTTTALAPKYRVQSCPDAVEPSDAAVSVDHEAEVAARAVFAELDAAAGRIADTMATPQPGGNAMTDGNDALGKTASSPNKNMANGTHLTVSNGHQGVQAPPAVRAD